jgi:hypothetical protein
MIHVSNWRGGVQHCSCFQKSCKFQSRQVTQSEIPVIKVSILQIVNFIVHIRAKNEIYEQFLSFIIIDDYIFYCRDGYNRYTCRWKYRWKCLITHPLNVENKQNLMFFLKISVNSFINGFHWFMCQIEGEGLNIVPAFKKIQSRQVTQWNTCNKGKYFANFEFHCKYKRNKWDLWTVSEFYYHWWL